MFKLLYQLNFLGTSLLCHLQRIKIDFIESLSWSDGHIEANLMISVFLSLPLILCCINNILAASCKSLGTQFQE